VGQWRVGWYLHLFWPGAISAHTEEEQWIDAEHNVAIKSDYLEVVPSAGNSCENIVNNLQPYWGAAFPPNGDHSNVGYQIEPFSLVTSDDFIIYYVHDVGFEAKLCGLDRLNITFHKTDFGYSISHILCNSFCSSANLCLQTGPTVIITQELARLIQQRLLHLVLSVHKHFKL
jgi:hypothetical protein